MISVNKRIAGYLIITCTKQFIYSTHNRILDKNKKKSVKMPNSCLQFLILGEYYTVRLSTYSYNDNGTNRSSPTF